jgi:C-terminal processing protease CtpA/Prc
LLELGPQLFHPSIAGDAVAAAMHLVSSADAVVIDLRACVGGSPETVALICSYLFDEETHLTDLLTNDPAELQQRWTMPWVPGPRVPGGVPVRVLVSGQTFSGGEDLAYTLQQSGRATVVGETTRGGAHPRRGFKVHSHLEATVPVAYSRNSVSGTNWEGVGVAPDIVVPAESALEAALDGIGVGGLA